MTWLGKNHDSSSGVWLRFAKKASGLKSVSYQEALDAALCYGWFDGQAKKGDSEEYWIQRFTPRRKRSIWSKRNREKTLALIESGEMRPGGLAEIERAKQDGRWAAAYDSPKNITVPLDLQVALDKNRRAKSFFEVLDSRKRYAILFRIHTAKKGETRTRRIQQFVAMLAKDEKLYP
ncbi:MAG: YdeI/OmpD-associated family protein [Chthoniobacterales bacterium]|nr:YdeI/OmpD-associated family protein [Chthoniobacterales bacterium]